MSAHESAGNLAAPAAGWRRERLTDAIERQMIWGERVMVCRLTIAPGTVTAVHAHAHEQITIVERGRVRFTIDGSPRVAGPGDVLHFPPGCEHGATMLEEEVVLTDVFSPVRDDLLAGGSRHERATCSMRTLNDIEGHHTHPGGGHS